MNKITLIGNLTTDPEVRTTTSGITVCSFRVAVDRKFKDADGNRQSDFIPVVVWKQLGELCGKYLAKGRKVAVVGSLQTRTYEKDDIKRTVFEIIADEVEFLTPKDSGNLQQNNSNEKSNDGFEEDQDEGLPF